MSGMVWPDGGAVLDQPNALVEAFTVIGNTKAAVAKQGRQGE